MLGGGGVDQDAGVLIGAQGWWMTNISLRVYVLGVLVHCRDINQNRAVCGRVLGTPYIAKVLGSRFQVVVFCAQ